MKKEVVIEKKEFVNSKNERLEYIDISIKVGGQNLRLQFKDDDKKLGVYLLNQELSKVGDNK